MKRTILRGDMYYFDLSPAIGSEQNGLRPVLIVQNNQGNKFSSTVIVAAISSKTEKSHLPTHIIVTCEDFGLSKDSLILLEQVRTIDKQRLRDYIGRLDEKTMKQVDKALALSFGLIYETGE